MFAFRPFLYSFYCLLYGILLFFHRTYGEPVRTVARMLWVHVTRIEVQVTTVGGGRSPGRPEEAYLAEVHNSTGAAAPTISISKSKRIKEYSTSRFPTIGVEEISLVETTTNIELTTVSGVVTSRSKSCKRCSFWLNKPRWGRGVDCFCCCCICYARITCEILVPELEAMAAAPVIITYIIEREWVLNSSGCSLITTNSQPLTLVIIIGLKFLRFISSTKSKIFFSSLLFQLHLFDTKSLIISLLNSNFNFTLSSPVFTSNFAFKVCFRLLHTIFKLKKVKMG